ncbi:hypothetical protein FPSE_10853, partial [Fusarium pseudograminearum CS3096]
SSDDWRVRAAIFGCALILLVGETSDDYASWLEAEKEALERLEVAKLLLTNWIVTSSYNCGLPLWMDDEILEISLCEVMKSLWHQPFNRYAWLVEHEYSQFEMSYHANHIIILGHVFSMLARLFLSAHEKTEQDFYNGNVDVLVEVARRLSNPESDICHFRTVNAAEHYLRLDGEIFAPRMAKIIRRTIKVIREETELGEASETESHNVRLRAAVDARRAKVKNKRMWIISTEAAGIACKIAYH